MYKMPNDKIISKAYRGKSGETLNKNITQAWSDYNNPAISVKGRDEAQQFLAYVFNLDITDFNNGLIKKIIKRRETGKTNNREYEPRQGVKRLLFNNTQTLSVHSSYKNEENRIINPVIHLSPKQRDKYRTIIYKGEFYNQGKAVDTTKIKSHSHEKFAAFTLNANAELSIFPHSPQGSSTEKALVHSSMNAGQPVVCAGEIVIENGKLTAISPYSGHYKPSLFNTYRTLCHFANKGVDLTNVTIHIPTKPDIPGVTFKSVGEHFEINAIQLMTNMKDKLAKAITTIKKDIESYQSSNFTNFIFKLKDKIIGSELTTRRENLSKEIDDAMGTLSLSDDFKPNKLLIKELIATLKDFKYRNNEISKDCHKSYDTGRLNHRIDTFITQLSSISNTDNLDVAQITAITELKLK